MRRSFTFYLAVVTLLGVVPLLFDLRLIRHVLAGSDHPDRPTGLIPDRPTPAVQDAHAPIREKDPLLIVKSRAVGRRSFDGFPNALPVRGMNP